MNNFGLYILCLFIFNSCFCEGRIPYKRKKTTEPARSETKSSSLSKRDLEDGIEDDASDVSSTTLERESIITSDDEVPVPVSKVSAANKLGHGCNCHGKIQSTGEIKKKAVPSLLKGSARGNIIKINSMEQLAAETTMRTRSTTTSTVGPVKMLLEENHFELNEVEFQPLVALKKVCPYYKEVPELDIAKMADVWQLIYFKSQHKLSCFKMYLKKTNPESRKHYEEKFSNFNGTINWKDCFLELNSIGKPREDKKHFLQGTKKDGGILENMVVMEEIANNTTIITLQEQSPDQWLVTRNLLIMRDCDNGDVAIFNRIPFQPSKRDIEEAMIKFGEDGMNETEPCVEPSSFEEKDFEEENKYEILS